MNPAVDQRIAPGRVVLILTLLLVTWLVFQFYPRPPKPVPPIAPVMAESKLRAVGLEDNPDWQGLPEFFAVWADHAEWKDGRTQFAYWNSVSRSYADFFEAVRESGRIRFRPISKAEMFRSRVFSKEGNYTEAGDLVQPVIEDPVDEFVVESPTHPFVFPKRIVPPTLLPIIPEPARGYHGSPEDPSSLKSIPTSIPPPMVDLSKPPNARAKQ